MYDWQIGSCVLCYCLFEIWFQCGKDGGYVGKVGNSFCVVVKLLVIVGVVVFMGVYYWCKGVEIVLVQQ